MKPLLLSFLLLLCASQSEAAQQSEHDTAFLVMPGVTQQIDSSQFVREARLNLHPLVRKAIMPSILIGWGITHMGDEGMFEGSEGVRNMVQRNYPDFKTSLDDHTGFAPVLMAVGLNLSGVKGEHHYTEQAVLLGMTYLVNRTLTNNLKSLTRINRPDGQSNDAFPSGHTSTAFAYATFFHREYGSQSIWYSVAGYSFASATGVMRILNDRHWFSDVLTGAGVGILSAEIAYLAYPLLQRSILNSFKEKQNIGIAPYYNQGAGGLAFVYRIN